MKSRTVLNIALFISIIFITASFIGFLLTFVVKSDQVFVPIGKNYYKSGDELLEKRRESFYFGKNPENISSANIFDSESRTIVLSETKAGEDAEKQNVPEISREDIYFFLENPDKCALMSGMELSGTIVAKDPEQSIAILRLGSGKQASAIVARAGGDVTEGVVLGFVWRNLVIFRTTNGVKCLGEGVGETKTPLPEQKIAEKNQEQSEDDDFDIRKVGENQYVIKRADLNKATSNLGVLASQARIVPSKKDNGFKIFSITKNSLYTKIGIQNGDVLKSINGIELSSPDKALEAYSRLQSASKLSLEIIRRGQNETMEYSIE